MSNQPIQWKMRDGNYIDIDSMDINHLKNTLKMIVKSKATKEFKLNGDMAQEFNDSNFSDEDDDRFGHGCEFDIY